MQILSFKIENFRNLQLAECDPVPNFMVICGGNGCGKSSILEALMTAKEHAGSYGNFQFDPGAVSANADKATIQLNLEFSDEDRDFVDRQFGQPCPEHDEVIIEITKGGGARVLKRSTPVHRLLSSYSSAMGSSGFFDYITAHRQTNKTKLQTWDASFMSDERAKQTLARSQQKFQFTKQYLAGLKMGDLQAIQAADRTGNTSIPDSLQVIRSTFNEFFAPMKFMDVYINRSPFEFVVWTPMGNIDIDDLSSGEKEIFNIFVRFHQLDPQGAVILFDEADAHLHPDLERRYLEALRKLTRGNQLILTTHSPEMMIAARSDSLYTVLKHPQPEGGNQLVRVTANEHLHDVLSDLMGSRGLVSFNQRIVFIEGEEASADRAIYESFYPSSQYNISFVPTGNSSTVRKTAEQVNALLTASTGFQQYYSIVDRDIDRSEEDPTGGSRLFRLPVYHVENFLLDTELIFEVTNVLLRDRCPYTGKNDVEAKLMELLFSDTHLKPYARAILDSELAAAAQEAYDAVYKQGYTGNGQREIPKFARAEEKARVRLEEGVRDDTWKSDCKGRDLLKAYCHYHGFKYEHFRNSLIAKLLEPPSELAQIMDQIIEPRTEAQR